MLKQALNSEQFSLIKEAMKTNNHRGIEIILFLNANTYRFSLDKPRKVNATRQIQVDGHKIYLGKF